jgi:spectrin beta
MAQRPHFIDIRVILQVFKKDADLLENWLTSREPLLHDGKLGETIAQVDDLIRKHEGFEKTVQAQDEQFSALKRVTMVGSHFVCVCMCMCMCVCVCVCLCLCLC